MKLLTLTQGQFAMVDDEMYPFVNHWKWYAAKMVDGKYYDCRGVFIGGKRFRIYLSRFIMGIFEPKIFVDHRDGNPLNNCNENLRQATNSQNQKNKKAHGSSMYLGVSQSKNRWRSVICVDGKNKWLGSFSNEIDAAKAYNKAAIIYHGEFANLNII